MNDEKDFDGVLAGGKKCELILGDCLKQLKTIPNESIDLVLTDVPYGLTNLDPLKLIHNEEEKGSGFMGKKWDNIPNTKTLLEIKRVMKDGAFFVTTFTPRQDALTVFNYRLLKAGFSLSQSSMFHLYHTGFPKALDISKAIDKKGEACEKYSELSKELCNYLKLSREKKGLSQKDIKKHFLSKTGGLTGCVWNWENGANIPTMEQWKKLKELLELKDEKFINLIERAILKRIEAEREVIGLSKYAHIDRSGVHWVGGKNEHRFETAPALEESKRWVGWKSCGLKPAVEVIVIAQKPRTEKTIVGQVLKNGCGAVNVDGCRIPYANEKDKESIKFEGLRGFAVSAGDKLNDNGTHFADSKFIGSEGGRFPANLLVEGNPLIGKGTQSTDNDRHNNGKEVGIFGKYAPCVSKGYNDSGSPNRFFSLDAWAKKNNITLTENSAFFDVPKPSKSEKNLGCEELEEKKAYDYGSIKKSVGRHGENTLRKNSHPTCKPVKLFSYLAKLFCQPNGLILDPFLGSGTTGIASLQQNFRFIGIEKEKEYFEIANKRINILKNQTSLVEDGGKK